ncbi:maleylacetate reductase and hydroxyquinol 1,2-dioxygenase domain-containing protein [Umezawaea endophytica]|uniref:Maleylacetate reductase and hydroxyquinol 1,2-dioxygenase domain-containing protein n=1 Tax=Umezawaea endophytica TaxID=1654476 RepID=A0A9X2VQX7_9PSEU|nr:maleylacetate reductase and hydroxyquinol 1,2-dioxygenase domain-containing protein [Umezawaea endophytica]MCS7481195.1 maleylacetate reductase and hydroxyquinol 1,2-dioxygenase domain-containing protein [Umezawaea endophytica]
MKPFVHEVRSTRIVFGSGTISQVRAEVERVGGNRVLLLASKRLDDVARRVGDSLGPSLAARFDGAVMHTPVEVTERALEVLRSNSADCVVAIGGGSTTGLSKALAARTNVPQVIVPTTYSGSEVTAVLGETQDGRKTTRAAPEIRPETVVYDVDLTLGLPVALSVTSGVNALAHAVEALYSPQAEPVTDAIALDAITRISRGLRALSANPSDVDTRADLLTGAWLAGTCLGSVGMSLHHKLCHTLGGSFGLPHAETHTVVLPHAMAYNAPAAPEVMERIARAMGVPEAPAGVYDLIVEAGGPTSLRSLDFPLEDVPLAVELATSRSYPNPREVTSEGVAGLLANAWHGKRPASRVPDLSWLTADVVASFDRAPSRRTRLLLEDLVRRLHSYATENDLTQPEWQRAVDFLTRTGQISSAVRQEFVLLSDTLGLSSVVDALTNSRTPDSTPSAVLGPFYVDGPPAVPSGTDLAAGLTGVPLWADVHVTDPDGLPLEGAVVDVWQADDNGFYDIQLPDLDGPVLRARFTTDANGRFTFWSILPSAYPIPDDGPVGELLAATGRHQYRAPHVHFMITAPGHERLITQLFVAGGDYLDSDTVFGVKEELVVDFRPATGATPDGRTVEGEWRHLDFTFRLARTAGS